MMNNLSGGITSKGKLNGSLAIGKGEKGETGERGPIGPKGDNNVCIGLSPTSEAEIWFDTNDSISGEEIATKKFVETTNEELSSRLDNLIISNGDGNKDSELIDARNGESTLGNKIRKIDESLEQSVKFKVVGEGATVPPINGDGSYIYDDTEIRKLINETNTSLEHMANKIIELENIILEWTTYRGDVIIDNYDIPVNLDKTKSLTLGISLSTIPKDNIEVLISKKHNFVNLNKSKLLFTTDNYSTKQTVEITGTDVGVEHITVSIGNKHKNIKIAVLDYDDDIVYNTVTENDVTANCIEDVCYITSYVGDEDYINIPNSIYFNGKQYDKVTVYNIQFPSYLRGVKFSDGIYVNDNTNYSFKNCVDLRYVINMPNKNSKTLDFSGCTSLLSLPKIPNGITSIKAQGCSNMKVISQLPSTLTSLSQVFWNCDSVTDISNLVIPSSLKVLNQSFSNMPNLSIGLDEIPEWVTDCNSYCYDNLIDYIKLKNSSYSNLTNLIVRALKGCVVIETYLDSPIFNQIQDNAHLQNGSYKPVFKDIEDTNSFIPIKCFGDSLTAGQNVAPNYPTCLHELIQTKNIVYNYGIGGYTTDQISEQMNKYSKQLDDGVVIIWSGTNDITMDVETHLQKTKDMIAKLNTDKYIVIGLMVTGRDNENRDAAFKNEFKNNFLNIREFILKNAFDILGTEPTEQDLIDIENGAVPSSLRFDQYHLLADGNRVVAEGVYRKLKELNYIIS